MYDFKHLRYCLLFCVVVIFEKVFRLAGRGLLAHFYIFWDPGGGWGLSEAYVGPKLRPCETQMTRKPKLTYKKGLGP